MSPLSWPASAGPGGAPPPRSTSTHASDTPDGGTMRALVFHGPWEMTVEDRPEPQPADGDTLLEIVATGICGSDLHGYTGENGRRFPGQIMGHETVGRVLADPTG